MSGLKIFLLLISLHQTQPTTDDAVESCLIKILKKYFRNQPVLLITDLTVYRHPFQPSLLPNLEREAHREIVETIMGKKKWTLQIFNTDRYLGLPERLKLTRLKNCFFFIQAETVASNKLFEWEMDRLSGNPLWNSIGRTVIVARSENPANSSEEVARRIIEKVWTKSKSVNNLVVVAESSGNLRFYTWFPYKQPDCSSVNKVIELDTYKDGRFQQRADLFPEKIDNDLQGCELIAATEECIPYVIVDENNSSQYIDGLEYQIFNSLADMLNFKLVTVSPENIWTTYLPNKSLTGAFKLLVEQQIDMAYSCLMLNRERYVLALALPSYYEDELVWFVPSPSYRPHIVDIFYTFPVYFWLRMILVMIAALAVVILLTYFHHDWASRIGHVLKLIGMSIYAPVEFPAKRYHIRLFVFVFFVYSMHITVAFQSSLFALYRKRVYSRYYTTLEQAVDDGLTVFLRTSTPELYNQSDHALWAKILQPGRHSYLRNFGDVFTRIAEEKTAVALFIKTTGIYMISVYWADDYGVPQIRWLKEKFSPYPITTFLPPGSPLFDLFEMRMYRLMASGLIRIWLKRAILAGSLHNEKQEYENQPLSMTHMGGPFFLLLLLLTVSVFTFLGEVAVFYLTRKSRVKKKPHRNFYARKIDVKVGHKNFFY